MATLEMNRFGRWSRSPLEHRETLPWLARLLAGRTGQCAAEVERGTPTSAQIEALARRHRLGPLLFGHLDEPLRRVLPRRLQEQWREDYTRRWLANEDLVRRMGAVLAHPPFDQGEWMVLKGPHWAERFWGDLAHRAFEDLDVLLPRETAMRFLHTVDQHNDSRFASAFRRLEEPSMHARSVRIALATREELPIDVHWALRQHPSFRIDHTRLWSTAGRFDGERHGTVAVPSDEYALVLALLETFDDVSRLEFSIKGLLDVLLILLELDSRTDWREFFAARRSERLERLSVDVLQTVIRLFDAADLLPSLHVCSDFRRAPEARGTREPRTLAILTRPTSRLVALWTHRLALYDVSRTRALAHLAWSAPVRVLLGWRENRTARPIRYHDAAPPSRE